MAETKDFFLPDLNPLIELFPYESDDEGAPRWTLYNPVSNSYFRIEWAEFECLSRIHRYRKASELQKALSKETTLEIDLDDIQSIVAFLKTNDLLVETGEIKPKQAKEVPLFQKILKTYLFVTIPLVKPQAFLERTVFLVRPFISSSLTFFVFMAFLLNVLVTLPRADEFFATFPDLLSFEGVILGMIVFALIKICHELGHAYTATHYGVPVSHMGVAFMVLYPVLYTEATGGWRLRDARKRVHIGLAGVIVELYIATFFLILWHFVPPGFLQTLSFMVVAITFIGSVLINLNPLMRFDGYYILSDALGYENLQDRSIAFARWRIRKVLFGLHDPQPEDVSEKKCNFLALFGLALLVYRLFLFLGIALLVYFIFFKPLGLFLMLVELWWFIGRPVYGELKIWTQRRHEIFQSKRSKVLVLVVASMIAVFCLPVQSSIQLPAVRYASDYQAIYPPSEAFVQALSVKEGMKVEEGDVLAILSSEKLEKDVRLVKVELKALKKLRRTRPVADATSQNLITLEDNIAQKEQELLNLEREKQKLVVKAPFSGQVSDMPAHMHEGRYVQKTDLLFRITKKGKNSFSGYVREQDLTLLEEGQMAFFTPDYALMEKIPLHVARIETTASNTLYWPELASSYDGPIATDVSRENNRESIAPRNSIYRIEFKGNLEEDQGLLNHVQRGSIQVQTSSYSSFEKFFLDFLSFLRHELNFNT